tara:strand:- start:698 stop:1663 length:966 start_codon:yes stop_codon:yes gene_type:complete
MDNQNEIKMPKIDLKKIKLPITIGLASLIIFLCVYTVDANEQAVVLRLGKYLDTTDPGLHFKIPFIDSVYKVKVDYQWKEEFGFRTKKPGIRTSYSQRGLENESWMLTGNLKIAEVHWVVQYKIKDPFAYLFNVKNVENTIRDVSESTMRLMIGDRAFKEVLQKERTSVANGAKNHMQNILDKYDSGIQIQMVQLQGVVPPGPVADSFNEVNRAKQEEETLVNEANQEYNKKVYNAEGLAEKLINEAEGYAVERVNNAIGDTELFNAILNEYNKAPDITKKRLFLETMEKVLASMPDKMIIDSKLEGVLPLLNLDKEGVEK